MSRRKETLEGLKKLSDFLEGFEEFSNIDDTRNVTQHSIYLATQNAVFSLSMAAHLENTEFYKGRTLCELSPNDIETNVYNYLGFIKDAWFNGVFIAVESHIRTITAHYDEKNGTKLLNDNIKATIDNLIQKENSLFYQALDENELKFFRLFIYLRNTMHNIGKQNKDDQTLCYVHKSSLFFDEPVNLELIKGNFNNFKAENLFYLVEQIILLIRKLDARIDKSEFIVHPLVEIGYNEQKI
jgi:hypothetical protein